MSDPGREPASPGATRDPLAAGAGRGQILFLDAASGIAGDMTVAALIDLGVPAQVVEAAVGALGLRGTRVRVVPAWSGAIAASRFEVKLAGRQPERSFRDIDRLLARAPLAPAVRDLARRIFRRLAEAEAEVHRTAVEEVHFHEVGAVDSIVDIVGAAACFVHVGATVVASPLPLGRGHAECRHGVIPLPAPATVLCLRGVPTTDAGIPGELVTPTGAAIVATVAERFAAWPEIAPVRVGWGAGTRVLPDRPNALRAVLGTPSPGRAREDTHVVIEANLDDATGELVGHVLGLLMERGALDAWAAPVTMKKGRPGIVLSVLVRASDMEETTETLLAETPSIGVRRYGVSRVERPRRIVRVATPFGEIPVKVSEGPHGAPVRKPEIDACAAIARATGTPLRDVLAAATVAAEGIGRPEGVPAAPPARSRRPRRQSGRSSS